MNICKYYVFIYCINLYKKNSFNQSKTCAAQSNTLFLASSKPLFLNITS